MKKLGVQVLPLLFHPIGELKYGDLVMPVNNGEIGEVTHMLYDTLTGIQWGKIKDEFGWTVKID